MTDRGSDIPTAPAEAVSPVRHQPPRAECPRHRRSRTNSGPRSSASSRSANCTRGPTGRPPPKMRFYSAVNDGKLTHHTVALVESANLPPPAEWVLANSQVAINHVALTMPNREAWLKQLAFLQSQGRQVQLARQPRRDAQRLYQRPERLRRRVPLRVAARDVGKRHRRRDQLAREPADRGSRSADRPHRQPELRAQRSRFRRSRGSPEWQRVSAPADSRNAGRHQPPGHQCPRHRGVAPVLHRDPRAQGGRQADGTAREAEPAEDAVLQRRPSAAR